MCEHSDIAHQAIHLLGTVSAVLLIVAVTVFAMIGIHFTIGSGRKD